MGEASRRARARRDYEAVPPGERLGDAPVEARYHDQMTALCKGLDAVFNGDAKGRDRRVGFVLMTFGINDGPSRCNYMSNGIGREDIVALMKEMIARFEGMPWQEGNA